MTAAARLIAFGFFSFAALALSAQDPPAPKLSFEDFYPLAVGSQWTYAVENEKKEFVVRIAPKTEKIGEVECFVVEAVVDNEILGTEHVALDPSKGFVRYKFGKEMIVPPITFLKAGVQKGESWDAKFKVGEKEAVAKFTAEPATIKVPAGEYSGVKVSGEVVEGTNNVKTQIWFVPKIGVVKQIIDYGDSKIVLDLKSYTLGKK